MILLRKFYDVAAEDGGGSATTETAPISLAAMMASVGHKTENSPVNYTKEIKENKTQNIVEGEKPKEETKIAESATSETEKVKPETKEQPKAAEEAPKTIAQEQPKQPTLQEVLKTVQPKAALQAMGLDDDEIAILDSLKGYEQKKYFASLLNSIKEGKGTEYLREWNTDYSKMPAEDVMRHQLQRDYPKATPKQLGVLFKKEVIEKYNLNSDDEDEKEEGILMLDAVADRHRDNFVANQKNFLTPKAPEPKPEIVDNSEQERANKIEAYKNSVTDNVYTKELFNKKILTIGEGENKVSLNLEKDFNLQPSDLMDILFDGDKWAQSMFTKSQDKDGKEIMVPDVEKQLLVALAAKDPKGLIRELSKYFKSVGGKAAIDPLENAKPKDGDHSAKSQKQPQTMAEAMAKAGKIIG